MGGHFRSSEEPHDSYALIARVRGHAEDRKGSPVGTGAERVALAGDRHGHWQHFCWRPLTNQFDLPDIVRSQSRSQTFSILDCSGSGDKAQTRLSLDVNQPSQSSSDKAHGPRLSLVTSIDASMF